MRKRGRRGEWGGTRTEWKLKKTSTSLTISRKKKKRKGRRERGIEGKRFQ